MHSWDVVNEVIQLSDGRPDGLRNSIWLDKIGPDYIELAFHVAANADPKALLIYNENHLEYDSNAAKRTAVLKLLERLKSRDVPVQALGIQAHLNGNSPFNPKSMRSFLSNVADMDLKIMITELDVADDELPADSARRDDIVASAYEDFLNAVLAEKSVIAVVTWGLADRYTWLEKSRPRKDGSEVRPLLLDKNLQPKAAWNAIARAFDAAPAR
jgi:endo-1,4-beta-xylanase